MPRQSSSSPAGGGGERVGRRRPRPSLVLRRAPCALARPFPIIIVVIIRRLFFAPLVPSNEQRQRHSPRPAGGDVTRGIRQGHQGHDARSRSARGGIAPPDRRVRRVHDIAGMARRRVSGVGIPDPRPHPTSDDIGRAASDGGIGSLGGRDTFALRQDVQQEASGKRAEIDHGGSRVEQAASIRVEGQIAALRLLRMLRECVYYYLYRHLGNSF